ncbi:MAG: T9SS type A sorting domain-containing protein, partial [Bacteroidetes bacterium]|nr:T9SS type A sorting domain-containing protein [Bacteroidota bacterium]
RQTSGTFCNDQITIFDGYDETAPILYGPIQTGAIPLGQRVVSTWGVITVRHFINDNNCNGTGFEADFNSYGTYPTDYSWSPTTGLSDPTSLSPRAAPSVTTTYTLTYGGGCTDQVTVTVLPSDMAGPDRTIRCGDSVYLGLKPMPHGIVPMPLLAATNGTSRQTIRHREGKLRDHANHLNVNAVTPHVGTRYTTIAPVGADSVEIVFVQRATTGTFCNDMITVFDGYDETAPILYGPITTGSIPVGTRVVSTWGVLTVRHFINDNNCNGLGFEADFNSFGDVPDYYSWTPTTGLSDPTAPNPRAAPSTTTTYTLSYGGGCTDQVTVTVLPSGMAGPDVSIGCGDSVYIGAKPMPHGVMSMRVPLVSGVARDTIRHREGILRDHANQLNVNAVGPHVGTRFTSIAPVGADSVAVIFRDMHTSGTFCDDQITIFDGYDETAPILYGPIRTGLIPAGTRVVSTWGVLTVRHFINDNNCNGRGFELDFNSYGTYPTYYSWTPTTGLSDPTILNPKAAPKVTTTYTLNYGDGSGCADQVTVYVNPLDLAGPDRSITCGDSVYIGAWTMPYGIYPQLAPAGSRDTLRARVGVLRDIGNAGNVNIGSHVGTRFTSIAPVGADSVELIFRDAHTSGTFCGDQITVFDGYDETAPVLYGPVTTGSIPPGTRVVSTWGVLTVRHFINDNNCNGRGFEAEFTALGGAGTQYLWSPTTGLDDPTSPTPKAAPATTTVYTLTVDGGCASDVTVTVLPSVGVMGTIPNRTIMCGERTQLAWQVNMNNAANPGDAAQAIKAPFGWYYDNGGPDANYTGAATFDRMELVSPLGAGTVSITFYDLNLGHATHSIILYDGPTTSHPVLATLTAANPQLNTTFTSTGGQILVRFRNTGNGATGRGWTARFEGNPAYPFTYSWSPTAGLDDPAAPEPWASPGSTTSYTLTVGYPAPNAACNFTLPVTVTVNPLTLPALPSYQILCGQQVMLGTTVANANNANLSQQELFTMPATSQVGANGLRHVASGSLFDRGGAGGSYYNNEDVGYTIAPIGATTLSLTFLSGSGDGSTPTSDRIIIYDGNSTLAPVLLAETPLDNLPIGVPVVSTTGMLTVRIISNNNNLQGAGFAASWTSDAQFTYSWTSTPAGFTSTDPFPVVEPTVNTTYTQTVTVVGTSCSVARNHAVTMGAHANVYPAPANIYCGDVVNIGIDTNIVMGVNYNNPAHRYYLTEGWLYDRGGPTQDYANNVTDEVVLQPLGATSVSIEFLSAAGDGANGDWIWVYNGTSNAAPLIYSGSLDALVLNTVFTATSGAMTVRMVANNNNLQGAGFRARWTSTGSNITGYSWTGTAPALATLSSTAIPWPSVQTGVTNSYTLNVLNSSGCAIAQARTLTVNSPTLTATPVTILCGDTVQIGNPPQFVSDVWMSNNTGQRHAPEGMFYDNGGPGDNYLHANWTYTIAPIGATVTTLVFTQAAGNALDRITLYDGTGTANPIIWGPGALGDLPLNTLFVAGSGRITINFDGDNSPNTLAGKGPGWVASWTSDAPAWTASWTPTTGLSDPTAFRPYAYPSATTNYSVTYSNGTCNLTHTAVVTVQADPTPTPPANFAGSDVSMCANDAPVQLGTVLPKYEVNIANNAVYLTSRGILYDDGGPAGNYTNTTKNWVATISPANAQQVRLTFTQGVFFDANDRVEIYNSATETVSNRLLSSSVDHANTIPSGTTIVSNTGIIRVRFITNNANVAAGFAAEWEVLQPAGVSNVHWSPELGLDNPYTAQPMANPPVTTTYTVTVRNGSCVEHTDQVTVTVNQTNFEDYRSLVDGLWSDINTWQVLMPGHPNTTLLLAPENESFWVDAATYNTGGCGLATIPDARSKNVFIRHTVDMDTSIATAIGVDQVSIVKYNGFAGNLRLPATKRLALHSSGTTNAISARPEDIYNQSRFEIAGEFLLVGGQLYNEDSSTVAYTGNGDQQMWNGKYGRLEIHNTGQKYVSGANTRVNTQVQFFSGYVTTGANDITLAQACDVLGAAFAVGYFVTDGLGSVVKEHLGPSGVPVFDFPVGHSTASYNLARMENSGATDDYAVRVTGIFENDPTFPTDEPELPNAVNRTWHIVEETPGGSDVTLRLHWVTAHENPGFDRTIARKTHYDNAIGWEWKSPEAPAQGAGDYTDPWWYETAGLNQFSPYSVASIVYPLNNDRLRLWGHLEGRDGLLTWEGDRSPSIHHYQLERMQLEPTFHPYQVINGQPAFVNGEPVYHYTDKDLAGLTYRYRVREYDWDGRVTLSNEVELYLGTDNQVRLTLYPNPAVTDHAVLKVRSAEPFTIEYEIYNTLGQVVGRAPKADMAAGTHKLEVPLAHLAAGTYTVRTTINGRLFNTRLIRMVRD